VIVVNSRKEFGAPRFYLPFAHGRYDVAPGLSKFGRDAEGDAREVFELDRTFDSYRAAKMAARAEGIESYYCISALADDVAGAVARFVVGRLVLEHPESFRMEDCGEELRLKCAATGEVLRFDREMRWVGGGYRDALDALACQVQEDLAVVSVAGGRHWLSAAHVCFPNGWAPGEKVGGSFAEVHGPVAGMGEMNRRGDEFARLMVGAEEGLVRFAWGVTFDDELNHHPGRTRAAFDPGRPRAFVRVERQTIWGLPAVGAALFTIRTYVYDVERVRGDAILRAALGAALRSMTEESRRYKGLEVGFGEWAE